MSLFHPVSAALADFVDFLWLADGYVQPHARERVLPTGCMGMVLSLDEQGRSGVSGARTGAMVLDTSKPLSLIGVNFKPGGGFPFFGLPAGELQDQSVPLETVWGRHSEFLQEQLIAAPSPAARFQLLEKALLHRLTRGAVRDPAAAYAVKVFQQSVEPTSVGAVVERTGLSARRFIATFRDQVGLTPKVFCRMGRFRQVLTELEGPTKPDWTSVALKCGYFDQAHFNHEFRAFAGISPTEYVRDRTAGPNHVRIQD